MAALENEDNVGGAESAGPQSSLTQQGDKVELRLAGTAHLIEDIDKRVLVVLRDGRLLIGYLRSVDQFGNLLLQHAIERIYVGRRFGDIERGIYVIRGENLVVVGELSGAEDAALKGKNCGEQVSIPEILQLQQAEQEEKAKAVATKKNILRANGLWQPFEAYQEEFYTT